MNMNDYLAMDEEERGFFTDDKRDFRDEPDPQLHCEMCGGDLRAEDGVVFDGLIVCQRCARRAERETE